MKSGRTKGWQRGRRRKAESRGQSKPFQIKARRASVETDCLLPCAFCFLSERGHVRREGLAAVGERVGFHLELGDFWKERFDRAARLRDEERRATERLREAEFEADVQVQVRQVNDDVRGAADLLPDRVDDALLLGLVAAAVLRLPLARAPHNVARLVRPTLAERHHVEAPAPALFRVEAGPDGQEQRSLAPTVERDERAEHLLGLDGVEARLAGEPLPQHARRRVLAVRHFEDAPRRLVNRTLAGGRVQAVERVVYGRAELRGHVLAFGQRERRQVNVEGQPGGLLRDDDDGIDAERERAAERVADGGERAAPDREVEDAGGALAYLVPAHLPRAPALRLLRKLKPALGADARERLLHAVAARVEEAVRVYLDLLPAPERAGQSQVLAQSAAAHRQRERAQTVVLDAERRRLVARRVRQRLARVAEAHHEVEERLALRVAEVRLVDLVEGEGLQSLEVRHERRGARTGRVVLRDSMQPLPGVDVFELRDDIAHGPALRRHLFGPLRRLRGQPLELFQDGEPRLHPFFRDAVALRRLA